ncbi:MAG: hypothetical protein OEN56_12105 [Gemmatimonadota bacterium]|nr:hypothetical protein [Gemmatimonadota bacterium]
MYQGRLAISEIEGETSEGVHRVQWDLMKRVERSADQQERMREQMSGGGGGGGGFGGGGVSREDRIRYEMTEAPPGEYRVVLTVDGRAYERTLALVKDEWWEERR